MPGEIKVIFYGLLILVVGIFGMRSCTTVPNGHVGVEVHLLGGSKGVDVEERGMGRYFLGINDEMYLFPTFTQTDVWKGKDDSITFQTREGLNVNADIGISYHVDPKRVSIVFQKYRKGIEEISNLYLHNMVRDALVRAASTQDIETVYGVGKAELLKTVTKDVQNEVEPIGIIVESISWGGPLHLPASVEENINAKINATQKAMTRENEIQATKAEAQKAIEEARGKAESQLTVAKAEAESTRVRGEAEADAIKAKSQALNTNPQLVQYEIAKNWNGVLPTTTMGSSSIPMIKVP